MGDVSPEKIGKDVTITRDDSDDYKKTESKKGKESQRHCKQFRQR